MKNLYLGFCILTLTIVFGPSLFGQQAKLRKAQHYMETLQYDKAIGVYTKLHQKDPSSLVALNSLAKAHQKSSNSEIAMDWFVQTIKQSELSPSFYFYYGQMLLQQGDCEQAQIQFSEFLHLKPYDTRRSNLENICIYWDSISVNRETNFTLYYPDFNTKGSELAPAFFNESLVFGSVRQMAGQKNYSYDLYSTELYTNKNNINGQLEFGEVNAFSNTLNTVLNEAIITFSPDYTEAYFTRNKAESIDEKYPISRLEILVSCQNGSGIWSAPKPLTINNPDYSTAHPALSPDGRRLFFASDRSGGFGGKDIYVCERNGLIWGTPINLGPVVNTEGDELYPFFHEDGELYFASDGQIGLGGHDVFKVKEFMDGTWGKVVNLGAPINSEADDFGLILNKDSSYGFLTSNRKGGKGGDDIYAFKLQRVLVELNLVDFEGRNISNMVALMEKEGTAPILTDENGQLSIWLTTDECKSFTIIDENYFPLTVDVCTVDAKGSNKLSINWTVRKKQITNTDIYASSKGKATVFGTVFDQLTGHPLLDAQIQLEGRDGEDSVVLTSDENGQFIYHCEQGGCFDVMISKEGFFAESMSVPLCINKNSEPQEIDFTIAPYRMNKEYEVNTSVQESIYDEDNTAIPYQLNIYYDLGRASVRSEGLEELNRLKKIMKDNPDLVIEVSSHTDTRGTAIFNKKLSQRRANAIVDYLIKRGITSNRLVGKGYGEGRLVNHCDGEIDCTEEEHQLNRRTEFRVLEQKYGHSN